LKRSVQRRQVNLADCDPAQIVHYPRFFDWFDRGTETLFRSVDLHWETMMGRDGFNGTPLVDASASFRSPARFGDWIEVESWIEEWRGRTFVVRHLVSKEGPEGARVTVAEGREIRVWALRDPKNPREIKAGTVPADIKARFED